MTTARFPVHAQLDSAGAAQDGVMAIDRKERMIHVRPKGSHQVYSMPTDMVADMICKRILFNRVHDEKRAKKTARRTG